jgi:hypothetical protein
LFGASTIQPVAPSKFITQVAEALMPTRLLWSCRTAQFCSHPRFHANHKLASRNSEIPGPS